ncbi:heat shock protein HspQ [Acuticoccus sp. I52.16.1]|uniref:Heat shock protein HspQ n=1 Tax=uncultured Rhizobiales bacterium HF4000_32B18 TaxID=710780 RepID=E0XWE9_9HYPH|nr:heat shock protein HspQ [Acuticoccus sp. I52.16.1]ADI18740.1 uncharacterized conserved protein [uncultured Rhizobiales bacterium HF4000_32B18]UOM37338.1 heat shock protein HspQ [Acuticoccus sp. I52.16.1]
MAIIKVAKFNIGQAVRHRVFDYAGVIVDIDAVFGETDAWYQAIPAENRPNRDQPFYRVRVDYEGVESVAYVSEQNLVCDAFGLDTPAREFLAQLAPGEASVGLH